MANVKVVASETPRASARFGVPQGHWLWSPWAIVGALLMVIPVVWWAAGPVLLRSIFGQEVTIENGLLLGKARFYERTDLKLRADLPYELIAHVGTTKAQLKEVETPDRVFIFDDTRLSMLRPGSRFFLDGDTNKIEVLPSRR